MIDKAHLFAFFVSIWIVLIISIGIFYFRGTNGALKRKWHPIIMSFNGVLFIIFAFCMGTPFRTLLFLVPFVAIISIDFITRLKFCDYCGDVVYSIFPFTFLFSKKIKYCLKCGSKLQTSEKESSKK